MSWLWRRMSSLRLDYFSFSIDHEQDSKGMGHAHFPYSIHTANFQIGYDDQ
jgi:hypothetical protein